MCQGLARHRDRAVSRGDPCHQEVRAGSHFVKRQSQYQVTRATRGRRVCCGSTEEGASPGFREDFLEEVSEV